MGGMGEPLGGDDEPKQSAKKPTLKLSRRRFLENHTSASSLSSPNWAVSASCSGTAPAGAKDRDNSGRPLSKRRRRSDPSHPSTIDSPSLLSATRNERRPSPRHRSQKRLPLPSFDSELERLEQEFFAFQTSAKASKDSSSRPAADEELPSSPPATKSTAPRPEGLLPPAPGDIDEATLDFAATCTTDVVVLLESSDDEEATSSSLLLLRSNHSPIFSSLPPLRPIPSHHPFTVFTNTTVSNTITALAAVNDPMAKKEREQQLLPPEQAPKDENRNFEHQSLAASTTEGLLSSAAPVITATNKDKTKKMGPPGLQPTPSQLFPIVDRIFQETMAAGDTKPATVGTVMKQVQAAWGEDVSLNKSTKNLIRQRLKELVNQHPTHFAETSFPSSAAPSNSTSASTSSHHPILNPGNMTALGVADGSSKEPSWLLPSELSHTPGPPAQMNITAQPEKAGKKAAKPRAPRGTRKAPTTRKTRLNQDDGVEKGNRIGNSTRKNNRASSCQLCSNCPCRVHEEKAAFSLSQSDAAIERALLNRLQKLEKTVERYEHLTCMARRQLKRHRRDMWKKREAPIEMEPWPSSVVVAPRFLPDAQELDLQRDNMVSNKCVPESLVAKALDATFPFQLRTSHQPTLTQMLGVERRSEVTENINENKEDTHGNNCELRDEISTVGHGEKLETKAVEDLPQPDSSLPPESPVHDEEGSVSSSSASEAVNAAQRILWPMESDQEGTKTNAIGVWESMMIERYDSAWDHLFDQPGEVDDEGVDQLISLMGCEFAPEFRPSSPGSVVMSMLSPQAQRAAERFILETESKTADVLENFMKLCPRWKENVMFAFLQKEEQEMELALENVRQERSRIVQARSKILGSLAWRQRVLDLFEDALRKSLLRFVREPPIDDPVMGGDGFMPSQASQGPAERPSLGTEVATIVPSDSPVGSECGSMNSNRFVEASLEYSLYS